MLAGVAVLFMVGVTAYAASLLDHLPSVKGLSVSRLTGDTIITDRNGVVLADISDQGNRRYTVTLNQVSPDVINATVAIEDHTFWTNPGFSPTGILRAAVEDLVHHGIYQGGSTITQELVKNVFLTPQQTFSRKLQEVALAYRMTQTYSKRQIMQLYLNVTYYGEQQYGIQAAAETFFHRSAKDLDLAQAAMLAGLPQAPTLYDPVTDFQAAKQRQLQVLDAMVTYHYVTRSQAAAAYAEPLQVYPPVTNYLAPQFVAYVERELEQMGYHPGEQQLIVKTSLDYHLQQIAENIISQTVRQEAPEFDPNGKMDSAMVAMDPRTGEILALVGSAEWNVPGALDYASQVARQPGSSLKPFIYGYAIQNRILTEDTKIPDSPNPFVVDIPGQQPWVVRNYDLRSHGDPEAKYALASSLNIPAVKVILQDGVPNAVGFLKGLGVDLIPEGGKVGGNYPMSAYGPSVVLGGYSDTLLEEADAYCALADEGVWHPVDAILEISSPTGQVYYQADPAQSAVQKIDPGAAYIVSDMISNAQYRTLAFAPNTPLTLPDRRVAAKTGTTDDFKDGLTVGYTPQLVAAFWVGDVLGSAHHMVESSDGVVVAAPAWHQFMEEALRGQPAEWYSPPPDVVQGPDGGWYLQGTEDLPDVFDASLSPTPTTSPQANYNVPPAPPSGPQLAGQNCSPLLSFLPGCQQPTPPPLPGNGLPSPPPGRQGQNQ